MVDNSQKTFLEHDNKFNQRLHELIGLSPDDFDEICLVRNEKMLIEVFL